MVATLAQHSHDHCLLWKCARRLISELTVHHFYICNQVHHVSGEFIIRDSSAYATRKVCSKLRSQEEMPWNLDTPPSPSPAQPLVQCMFLYRFPAE